MARASRAVGVLAEARTPAGRWAERTVRPSAVLPGAPGTPRATRLGPEGAVETWYAGPAEIALHAGETAHYRDNLGSGRPALWVALRDGLVVAGVTADPYEGEAWAGDPGLVVEALAMPEPVAAWVADFVTRYHVEQAFEKRKRRPADAEALARQPSRVLDLRRRDD